MELSKPPTSKQFGILKQTLYYQQLPIHRKKTVIEVKGIFLH